LEDVIEEIIQQVLHHNIKAPQNYDGVAKAEWSWHQPGNLRVRGTILANSRQPLTPDCLKKHQKYSQPQGAFNEKNIFRAYLKRFFTKITKNSFKNRKSLMKPILLLMENQNRDV